MSGFQVTNTPSPARLRHLAVAEPLSGAPARRWADELAFLLAHALPPIAQCYPLDYTASPASIVVPYVPSPYCKSLMVGVELDGSSSDAAATVSAGGSWISANGLDGTNTFGTPYQRRAPVLYFGFKNVPVAFAPNVINAITITRTASVGAGGIIRVFLHEVPLDTVDPSGAPTTEASFNRVWPVPPGKVVEGTAASSRGFARIFAQLGLARQNVRRHITLATVEVNTTAAYTVTSVTPTFADVLAGTLYARARRLYTTATPEPFALYLRHRSTVNWTLRVIVTPRGGAPVNTDFAIAASVGVFTAVTPGTVNFPTSGTDQEVEVQFRATQSAAGTVRISTLGLISNDW